MHDSELKKLLLESCPIRPGQEARAWSALRDRLNNVSPKRSAWSWLYYPTWRGMSICLGGFICAMAIWANVVSSIRPHSFASADSKAPGIYATSFYSNSAKAQVVWLDGMDPATDKPTYLDPTSVIADKSETPSPAGDPNSL